MKRISKIIIYFIAVCMLAWLLPWLYNFVTVRPVTAPFTLYSCITRSFTSVETKKNGPTKYSDFNGNSYTPAQFDSINPFFYYRQLLAKENLPDTINGIAVTAGSIRKSNFSIKQTTREVNVNAPKLWMLMESVPSHVDLDEPKAAFRMRNEMTIINMVDNSIDTKKSTLFNKVLKDKGFKFPMVALNGDPTTKKEYDEGYIMIDSNHNIFHVKQIKGRPYVRRIDVKDGIKMNSAMITEFGDKKHLGFVGDEDNNWYVIDRNYNIHQLPFAYNLKKHSLMIIGNMNDWTVRIADSEGYSLFAINADDYSLIDKYGINYSESKDYKKQSFNAEHVAESLFPFQLSFSSPDSKWIKPSIKDISYKAFIMNLLLTIIFILLNRKESKKRYIKSLLILVMGIFIFLPLLIIKR